MSTTVMANTVLASDPGLPAFFLDHLASLAERQATSTSPWEQAALSVAIFSTFLDCLDLGLADEARQIIGHLQHNAQAVDLVAA
jgi:hypothetical protein